MSTRIEEAWRYAICPETGLPVREGDRCAYNDETGQFFHRKSKTYAEALLDENCKFLGL